MGSIKRLVPVSGLQQEHRNSFWWFVLRWLRNPIGVGGGVRSFYRVHLSRFQLKVQTEFSVGNIVFYLEDRSTDNVKNCGSSTA
jgi:hypothetical protein